MFDDNYKDTGVPTDQQRHATRPSTYRRALGYPIPADLRGGVGFQNTPRIQLANFDHTKRGYVQHRLHQGVQRQAARTT